MLALMNIDYTGINYKSEFARKYCFERLYEGQPITLYLDLVKQAKNDFYYDYKGLKAKTVIENTKYIFAYSRVIAYVSKTESLGTVWITSKNLTNRERDAINYYKKRFRTLLRKLTKVIIGYPYIYINGEFGEYLLILDKKPFNALSCDVRAFLVDENTVAETFTDIFKGGWVYEYS